jgi:hypothetical protein
MFPVFFCLLYSFFPGMNKISPDVPLTYRLAAKQH